MSHTAIWALNVQNYILLLRATAGMTITLPVLQDNTKKKCGTNGKCSFDVALIVKLE